MQQFIHPPFVNILTYLQEKVNPQDHLTLAINLPKKDAC